MPPRAANKEKRGPESWNPKKRKTSTDDIHNGDATLPGTGNRSRSKYPPGPDAATAVREEFFNLPGTTCNDKTESPPLQDPRRSHIPEDEERGKFSLASII